MVIAAESPDRDTLDSLKESSAGHAVVMFVDRSEPGLAEQPCSAGVACLAADGLPPTGPPDPRWAKSCLPDPAAAVATCQAPAHDPRPSARPSSGPRAC
ncbi:hypothetical protein ACRAWD_15360 [Caulobacter segnis]